MGKTAENNHSRREGGKERRKKEERKNNKAEKPHKPRYDILKIYIIHN